MIYEYLCEHCDLAQEVIKSMQYANTLEFCTSCGKRMRRVFSSSVHFTGTKVKDPEYQPAFGKHVKNKHELKDLMKKHNVEEIGNEKPETIHNSFDKLRQEKRKQSWEQV